MRTEIPEDGLLDGAMLFDARDPRNRLAIKEIIHRGQHVVLIQKRDDHLVVEYLHKVSGAPQWSIDFWNEERKSSITDTLVDAERLAEEFMMEAEPSTGG
jgi:hypothetical protein